MRRVALTVCAVWVCVLAWSEAFALERAALALSGQDCDLAHEVIVETLERLDGVAFYEDGVDVQMPTAGQAPVPPPIGTLVGEE